MTSRLIGRIGPRVPMTIGALLATVGLFWLSRMTVHASYVSEVLGPLLVLSIGLGQIFVSTSIVAVSGVTPKESGLASALLNVGRQLGGSHGLNYYRRSGLAADDRARAPEAAGVSQAGPS